jgi:hypothetical protein
VAWAQAEQRRRRRGGHRPRGADRAALVAGRGMAAQATQRPARSPAGRARRAPAGNGGRPGLLRGESLCWMPGLVLGPGFHNGRWTTADPRVLGCCRPAGWLSFPAVVLWLASGSPLLTSGSLTLICLFQVNTCDALQPLQCPQLAEFIQEIPYSTRKG